MISTLDELAACLTTEKAIGAWDLSIDLQKYIMESEELRCDNSGQGGSTIWRHLVLVNGIEYVVDYVTFGRNLLDDSDAVLEFRTK